MSEISLFNEYYGKENTITNYCGLMMKLLYQSSPSKFQEFIVNLIDDESNILVEPLFEQQKSINSKNNKKSIFDLRIRQKEFELIFEVKTLDWFYEEQFDKYINNLLESEIKSNKIIFALTAEFEDIERFDNFKIKAKEKNIHLQFITFNQLLEKLKEFKANDEYYLKFLEEFEEYLENQNLLQSWKKLLDVVNCASTIKAISKGIYICPDTSGAYKHSRAKYFGPYSNKKVESIFEIDAVVVLSLDNENKVIVNKIKYNNLNQPDKEIKERALNLFNSFPEEKQNLKSYDIQVFLLSNEEKTNFIKDTPGGLFGSKIYFREIAKNIKNSKELAKLLNNKEWKDFK